VNISKPSKYFIIILVGLILIVAGVAYAAFWVSSNHITGTPEPTPTPSPTPTPTPTPSPDVVGATLSANDSGTVYVGDTLALTATLNVTQQDVPVRLFNNGNFLVEQYTDASGTTVFYRTVTLPYDYHVEVYNE